jgi:uncharacterized protein YbaP (TraB family)
VTAAEQMYDTQIAAYADALQAARESSGPGEPALWKLTDADSTVYIFGTMHLLKPGTDWQSERFRTAYSEADTIMLETDTSNPEAMKTVQKLMTEFGRFTETETLFDLLDADQEAVLKEASDNVGASFKAFRRVRPWLVTQQITTRQMMKNGYLPQFGVEAQLALQAQEDGKEFLYLETPADQLRALSAAPLQEQIASLVLRARTIDQFVTFLDQIIVEWLDGDIEGLGLMTSNPELQVSRDGFEALIIQRNRIWAPQLESLLDTDGTVLVAIGAAHLAGDEGVVKILERRGLKIEKVVTNHH